MIQKGNKKIINAWVMYDWANSAYSLVISSALFPIYFKAIATSDGNSTVHFIGRSYNASSLLSYSISAAFLVIAIINPLLSSIADYSGNKKRFMMFFTVIGSLACAALFMFDAKETIWIGIAGSIFSAIGYAGSIVFYNAYLPEIAEAKDQDKVSARGFAMGYIGSSLLLIFNLVMILKPEWFFDMQKKVSSLMILHPEYTGEVAMEQAKSFYAGFSTRISFLLVGAWWFAFALIPFYFLPKDVFNRKPEGNYIKNGYRELRMVWNELKLQIQLQRFLFAFFFYNMGVQTVMYVATIFGAGLHVDGGLELPSAVLIGVILIIQFVAIAGAFLFSSLSKMYGNIRALSISLFIWIAVGIAAFFCDEAYGVNEQTMFISIAVVVGLVMGGIQSLSRSTYSKMLPETMDHASYFSFFDACDKVGVAFGTMLYGMIGEYTGSMRNSILVLTSIFVVGLLLLSKVKKINPLFNRG